MSNSKEERRVGVEIEFSGLGFAAAADLLENELGARREALSDHEILLHTDAQEDPYRLEVDFELLKSMSRESGEDQGALAELAVDVLGLASSMVAPLEWITPPLPVASLPDLVPIIDALAAAGAVGSQGSWAYAFGAQFNPDVVRTEPGDLLAHLRAFCCLHDWLRARDDMDLARRLTTFAKPYPKAYEQLIADPDYDSSGGRLIDDYLAHMPTRNCALDMLPLFLHLDEDRVRDVVEDERVKPRPTFHYRLPNSRLGADDWSLLDPWNDWLVVEALAGRASDLRDLLDARGEYLDQARLPGSKQAWVEQCETWLSDRGLA
ncbi:MAG: amidoligase family protein [Xanthomonadales bacterium]|nr:amidoligase family protein [Xanthomonadales bacterium]